MNLKKDLYAISLFESYSNFFFCLKRRVSASFDGKELEDFLENEPAESNSGDFGKAKKAYALLLPHISDSDLASI